MVETRKKLKGTNKIRQYIKYRNKNELFFMSKNFTQKVVRCTIHYFKLITTLRPLNILGSSKLKKLLTFAVNFNVI